MPRPQRTSRPERRPAGGPERVAETSAGGIVLDVLAPAAHAAVIARTGRSGRVEWCLPKGHLEAGETLEQAAVREIAEETGIHGTVLDFLGSIEYSFPAGRRRIHKVVHHFLLVSRGGELSVDGDPDREADEAAWIAVAGLDRQLTFPNERRIARAAHQWLSDRG